ncbi:hypothetical protein LJC59_00840 [Desulfovibrio sp. OttesenSCG-928-A18]|nr:hypothetical protein [Desulfovibrio sp. OttesenSCG-928-A18]
MTGAERIAVERERQIEKEGWNAEHDAQHTGGELALAAVYYAMPEVIFTEAGAKVIRWHDGKYTNIVRDSGYIIPDDIDRQIGWNLNRDKKTRLRQLEIAGALIAAEIDRLLAVEKEQSRISETFITVKGKTFLCACGGQIFSDYGDNNYKCNACGEEYVGSPKDQPEPWASGGNYTQCPGFGSTGDCTVTHTCEHHTDCAASLADTIENYCGRCGRLNEECVCGGESHE